MFSSEAWLANPSSDFYNGVATQSLRFNDGDSAHLSFTPSSANGQTKCTISAWVKRATLGSEQNIFHAGTASGNRGALRFLSNDTLEWAYYNGSWILDVNTSAVYRDTTNWYHIVARLDTTDGTADIYVNGSIQTLQTSVKPSSSQNTSFGQNVEHQIGERGFDTTGYFDGYLSQVNFINGTDLTASSFAETKEGVWIPKNTSGLTFGTNGFQLEFKQTGTGTASASTIGADTSGNTNHLTSTNLVASDSNMPDCPENNFATGIGPLSPNVDSQSYYQSVWSEGNLKFVATAAWNNGQSNFGFRSGKWYAEHRVNALYSGSHYFRFGMKADPDRTYDEIFWIENGNGQVDATSSPYSDRVGTYTTGDILMVAVDLDSSTRAIWLGKNGTWENSATESEIEAGTTTNAFVASNTIIPINDGHTYFLYAQGHGGTTSGTWNFGQDSTFAGTETAGSNTDANGIGSFKYSVPNGFLAQCSSNLPEPTISSNATSQANDHFDAQIWSGDDSSTRAITTNFQPDFIWVKKRTAGSHHMIYDTTRGFGNDKYLDSSSTEPEGSTAIDGAQYGFISANASTSFTVAKGTSTAHYVNQSSHTYVGWHWKANGGTTTTNDASATGVGTIDSVYQANTDAGFSIVTFTGNGTSGATVKHGLTSALDMLIVKSRESSSHNWITWHKNLSSGYFINLNLTSAQINATARFTTTVPTASVFSLGNDTSTNTNGEDYVAYCFAEVEGYSRFGLYEGVGNNDGTFVFTGFSPSLVVTKKISGTGNWYVNDSARSTYNPTSTSAGNLYWDLSNAESGNGMDFLSNGFKIRNTDSSQNTDGSNYIYLAFAKLPWKFSNAR